MQICITTTNGAGHHPPAETQGVTRRPGHVRSIRPCSSTSGYGARMQRPEPTPTSGGQQWAGRLRVWATVAGAVAVLLVVPVTLARAVGGEQRAPMPLLAAAAPFAVPALVVAIALTLLGRVRWAAAVPGLLLVVHLAWLAPSLAPDGDPATSGRRDTQTLTVMTANILFGRADAGALVREVERRGVDVLAVQELTPAAVERLRAAGLEKVLPHSVVSPASGAAGTGLWTRLPTTELSPVATTGFAMPRVWVDLPDETAVTVTVAHPYPPLNDEGIRRWGPDMASLRQAVEQTTGPQVVAGDFNATRDHAPFRRLLDAGLVDAADAEGLTAWPGMTWPADRPYPPVMRLDHVLASPAFAVRDVAVVQLPGTDHRAVVARLTLAGTA